MRTCRVYRCSHGTVFLLRLALRLTLLSHELLGVCSIGYHQDVRCTCGTFCKTSAFPTECMTCCSYILMDIAFIEASFSGPHFLLFCKLSCIAVQSQSRSLQKLLPGSGFVKSNKRCLMPHAD